MRAVWHTLYDEMIKLNQILGAILIATASAVAPNHCLGDEIWVLSHTRLLAPSLPYHDSTIAIQLVDDANTPIPNAHLSFELIPSSGDRLQTTAITNASGLAMAHIDLAPGIYRFTATFGGNDIYGESSTSFDLRTSSCKPNANISFPIGSVAIPPNRFEATLTRTDCLDRSTTWIASADDESQRITLKPGVASANISLTPEPSGEGVATIEASTIESFDIEYESIQSQFFVLNSENHIFCEYHFNYRQIHLRCDIPTALAQWLGDRKAQCDLSTIPLYSGSSPNATLPPSAWIFDITKGSKTHRIQPINDSIDFYLPYRGTHQILYALSCPDTNDIPMTHGLLIVPNTNHFEHMRLAFFALCFAIAAGFGTAAFIHKRKRKRRSSPIRLGAAFPPIEEMTLAVRREIAPATRREYICQCFCEVAAHLLSTDDISWGQITPQQLAREFDTTSIRNSKRRAQLSSDIQDFCNAISAATYGLAPIAPEQIEAIYALSKRIITMYEP